MVIRKDLIHAGKEYASMVEKVWEQPEVYRISVALPDNPLRNLNVYVIRTPERSLVIDTGFCRPECQADLWVGLDELELDLSRTALLLTHFHSDHAGLVWDFVERDVPVYMGRIERDYFAHLSQGASAFLNPLFAIEGFPEEQLALQNKGNQARLYAPKHGFPITPLEDGDTIPLGGIEARVIHTPGHTPGHMVLYLAREQILFSGDHILFDITPNISVWPQVPHSLSDYITSLQKIRSLPVSITFPAHRAGGTAPYDRIDQIIAHHSARLNEIYLATAEHPGATAYQIAGMIRWSVRGLAWEAFPPHQRWFAVAETAAHLYYLADKGQLIRRMENGIARHYPT